MSVRAASLDDDVASELPFDPPLPPREEGIEVVSTDSVFVGDAVDGLAMSTYNPETGRAHLMYVSESLASMLGWTPNDLLGRSPELLISPSTPAAQLSAVAAIVEEGKQAVVRLDLRHADGSDIAVQASFLLVPSLPGQAPHFLALYRHAAAERRRSPDVLVDPSEMLDSLAYGRDLADVVHHVADRIVGQVPSAQVWVVLCDSNGSIEPVVTGRATPDMVTDTARMFTESASPGRAADASSTGTCLDRRHRPQPGRSHVGAPSAPRPSDPTAEPGAHPRPPCPSGGASRA